MITFSFYPIFPISPFPEHGTNVVRCACLHEGSSSENAMDNNRLILIADDSEGDVELLKIAIRKAHVSNPIQVVHDGQEAIDYLCGMGEFGNRQQYPFPG